MLKADPDLLKSAAGISEIRSQYDLVGTACHHWFSNLVIARNITLMTFPPRSPELNPAENVWQFMRENWLSNRVFKSCDDILHHRCHAWNKLESQPACIASIGNRKWADGF